MKLCAQRYVFQATFAIIAVIFQVTFLYFYAFSLTRSTIPLLFSTKYIYQLNTEILKGLLLEYAEILNGNPIRTVH